MVVSDDHLLSIGSFAIISGLSITALRHYDEVGVLRPAFVDPSTGYRRYRVEQVGRARLIYALRQVELPIDAIREALENSDEQHLVGLLRGHRARLVERAHALSQMVREVDRYIDEGAGMPAVKGSRIVQSTISATDRAELISFYQEAFDATFNEEIGSFQFGTWPSEEFFLLTISDEDVHPGPVGPARFGLVVEDLEVTHRRALAAGAAEVYPPVDRPWKPRSSCVADPSGNHIDLYQGVS